MIVKDSEFYAQLLPFKSTDQIHIKWNIFSFDRSMIDIEPTQGVPRLVTASQEGRKETLVRRGLAFMIEHGFYRTSQGRASYMLNLQQIAMSARLTTYAGVVEALLQCNNHYKLWNHKFGVKQERHNTLQRERANWALVNKSQNGLYLLDSNTKFEMAREGIKPDTWIFPPRMGMYVSMLPDHTSYQKSGPRGETQLIKQANLTMPTLRGSTVFEIEAFDTDFSGVPVNQLERARQCGEYFVFDNTMKESDSIHIYSAESDDFEKITKEEAAAAAWNPNSSAEDHTLVVFRPHQTWQMNSAILCERGEALGYTFHGNHSFLLQTDSLRKLHIGHYTYYSRSVVHDEKRMRLTEDIFCTGYIGGEGHDFWTKKEYQDEAQAGELGTSKQKKSLIALWVPTDNVGKKTNIDLRDANIQNLMEGGDGTVGNFSNTGFPSETEEYTAEYTIDNSICFRGMQYTSIKDGVHKGKPTITSINHGHWGVNVYARCKNHRIGLTGAHIVEQNHKKEMGL